MKKYLAAAVLCIAMGASAQIGIGTTSPNSSLDIRGSLSINQRAFTSSTSASSTDNVLLFTGTSAATLTLPDATTCMGRTYTAKNSSSNSSALTVATTSSQTIDGSSTYSLDELQKAIVLVSNGTNWSVVGNAGISKSRANFVIVKSASDFPAPVSGVITLTAGTTYEVNGTVVVTNKINLNGCYLIGRDANNDKVVYGGTTGELFTGAKGGTIKILTLVANTTGTKLFNLDMGATENLLLRDCIVANCKDVGLVKGGNICFFSVINFSGNTNGITFQNISNLLLENTGWFANNSGTFEKLIGTFDVIDKLGGFFNATSALSATALDITGITTINESGNLKSTAFLGTGTRVNGTFSKKWEVEAAGINSEKDAAATGSLYISTSALTDIITVNTPVKIAGTTTSAELVRFTSPTNNRLQYDGTKTRTFRVFSMMSATGVSGQTIYSFYIYKNGVQIAASKQKTKVASASQDIQLAAADCTVTLAPGDYVEVWAENNDSNTDLTVHTMSLTVK